jgi:hypothetical protein
VLTTQMVRASFEGVRWREPLHHTFSRGLSSQPSGFHLAIWRMRLPFLSLILFSQVQERGLARHGQFNTRNNFKRICVCRREGGQQCGCGSRPTLGADQWHRMEEGLVVTVHPACSATRISKYCSLTVEQFPQNWRVGSECARISAFNGQIYCR